MQLTASETNLVIVGSLNPAILNPGWVGKNVLDFPDGTEIPILIDVPTSAGLPMRFKIRDFTYAATRSTLVMVPDDHDDARLNATEQAARRILQLLPYTPVTGAGFNFQFIEEHPVDDAITSFNSIGASLLEHAGEEVNVVERKAVISFARQLGVVNATSSLAGGQLKVNFNFHYPLNEAAQLANIPQGRFAADFAYARNLMDQIYGLE